MHVLVDSTHVFRLDRDTFGITKGHAFYDQVRAVLVAPRLAPHEILINDNCWIGGPNDRGRGDMIGVAAEEDTTDLLTRIRYLWRANPATERFDELSTAHAYCVNEGFYERLHNEEPKASAPPSNRLLKKSEWGSGRRSFGGPQSSPGLRSSF